ncbi:MAG: helix-turn-helix domain-containing protein [Nocardioidaceae bacterium]|nr:helix-turn-helix domain-containing protein [Nocardioidaceae bacterium]MBA3798455.1 helix-turn-helix domain-containing protein [Geodermatophilaceae bacterium]
MATKTATPKTSSTKAAPAQTATLAKAAAQGTARFYRQRRNQTLRNLPYLAPSTKERTRAETVAKRREAGDTIATIADDLKVSVATVRRMLTGLLLAQQVEAGMHDGKWNGADKSVVVGNVGEQEAAAA